MTARTLILLWIIAISIIGLTACAEAPDRPNVVLITVDTLRSDHLHCYGYPKQITPNIDRLAEVGVLFKNVISQASTTPVSHASILTGQYPYHHGLRFLHGKQAYRLDDQAVTLAEMLKESGYKTAAFVSAFPLNAARYNLSQGFDHYDEDFSVDENTVDSLATRIKGIFNTGSSQRRSDCTNHKVFEWIQANRKEAFFIWVHYFDPHDAIVTPPASFLKQFTLAAAEPKKNSVEMYDAEIAYTDDQIGRLLKKMRGLELDRHTLYILTADHGQGLTDHGYWSHAEKLYQEQIQVPLIMRPLAPSAARKVDALVRTIDIVPTVLDMLAIPAEKYRLDGTSLMPFLQGRSPAEPLSAYSETHYPRAVKDGSPLLSLIDQNWKLIHYPEREADSQLFDLKKDPGETRNVIGEFPDRAASLKKYFTAHDVFMKMPSSPTPVTVDPAVIQKLRSLGYLNQPAENKASPQKP